MRRIRVLVGFLALGLALASCARPAPPLRVGIAFWPPHQVALLAQRLEYFEQPVSFIPYRSLAEQLRAYRNGNLDAIATTSDYLLQLLAHDSDHRVVMVIDQSNGADAILARAGIDSVADLRGRTVALEASGVGAYMLGRALDEAGLSLDEIELRSVDQPEHAQIFRQDPDVDAVVTFEPTRSELLSQGAVEIFSSREIPGEIVDLLIVRAEIVQRRHAAVQDLVAGWLRAQELLREAPHKVAQDIAANSRDWTPGSYLASLEGVEMLSFEENHELLSGPSPKLLEGLQGHARLMTRFGILQEEVGQAELREALEPGFLGAR